MQPTCPNCDRRAGTSTGRDHNTNGGLVWTFRCDRCGHEWTIPI